MVSAEKDSLSYMVMVSPYLSMFRSGSSIPADEFNIAIREHGIPFPLTLPSTVPVQDEMTTIQFNQMMATGLHQAKANESFDSDDVFDDLEKRD